jgi:predicted amidohydrolase
VLPEYFCLMGHKDTDKIAAREAYGDGPVQRFLAGAARELGLWIVGGTCRWRPRRASACATRTWCIRPRATAWRATTRSTCSGLTTGASSTTNRA